MTPANPASIPSQRAGLTLSPNTTAAPATTNSGVACRIAVAVTSGAKTKASA